VVRARVAAQVGSVVLGPRGQTGQAEQEDLIGVKEEAKAGHYLVLGPTNAQVIGQVGQVAKVATALDQKAVAIAQPMVVAVDPILEQTEVTTEETVGLALVALVVTDLQIATRTESKTEIAGPKEKVARTEDLMSAGTTLLLMGLTSLEQDQFSVSGLGRSVRAFLVV